MEFHNNRMEKEVSSSGETRTELNLLALAGTSSPEERKPVTTAASESLPNLTIGLYQTNCPDGTVVFTPSKPSGNACGDQKS